MRIIDLIESPISGMNFYGGDDSFPPTVDTNKASFDAGTSFGKADKAILKSEKGKQKIINAFSKTPFNFEIYFVNNKNIDGDHDMDGHDYKSNRLSDNYSNYSDYNEQKYLGVKNRYFSIIGENNKIKVVLLANLSDIAKMPINGWTLAHKIAHGIQDHPISSVNENMKIIHSILKDIYQLEFKKDKIERWEWETSVPDDFVKLLTMKSARDGNLLDGFEAYAEILAQYLITGSVKFKLKDERSVQLVPKLNKEIENLFRKLIGKVIVEI